ncbi:MAG: serine/threonine dehydratase [Cumulibacter sp.]
MGVPSRTEIAAAAALLAPHVRRTPVLEVGLEDLGTVVLKLEQLQHVGSFKPRGAFLNALRAEVPPTMLVAASGGNHGLAVAYVGKRLGIPAMIYVPTTAPRAKVSRLRSLGARVTEVGQTYADAYSASLADTARDGALAVHGYDGILTVTGQATMALEIGQQVPDVARIVVAVGGGGLMGGTAAWFGSSVELVAAEPEGAPTFQRACEAGSPVRIAPHGLASDSLGASRIGEVPFAAMRAVGVRPVVVSDAAIASARELLWRECRLAVEPGGAVALAAVLSRDVPPSGSDGRTVVVVCGANADPSNLPMN